MDDLISLIRVPSGATSDKQISEMDKVSKKFMINWRNNRFLMDLLKAHTVDYHLLVQYKELKGFGDHTGDFCLAWVSDLSEGG